jgi:3-oxoacyl-[acyl-carrier protein] reductase
MDLGITGKTALVVAASKGMGKASAMGLAAEGARVVMCARGEAALEEAAGEVKQKTGAELIALAADASRAADISKVVAEANRAFGGVDILVANVGGPPPGPFEQMTDDQWKAAFEQVHLSTVRFIREVLPHMKRAKWGRILAIQSAR